MFTSSTVADTHLAYNLAENSVVHSHFYNEMFICSECIMRKTEEELYYLVPFFAN